MLVTLAVFKSLLWLTKPHLSYFNICKGSDGDGHSHLGHSDILKSWSRAGDRQEKTPGKTIFANTSPSSPINKRKKANNYIRGRAKAKTDWVVEFFNRIASIFAYLCFPSLCFRTSCPFRALFQIKAGQRCLLSGLNISKHNSSSLIRMGTHRE